MPFDSTTTIDHLIYWNELPVDVPAVRQLLGCESSDPPPVWCLAFDFADVTTKQLSKLMQWCEMVDEEKIPGFHRQLAFYTYPHFAYVFAWTGEARHPGRKQPLDQVRHLSKTALATISACPAIGLGGPVADWPELRRAMQRATVGARLSWLRNDEFTGPEAVEVFLTEPHREPLPTAALLTAIARHDCPAIKAEAERIASSYVEAFLSPLSTLRVQLMGLLLRCGETARSAGVTPRLIDYWADHHLRGLWSVYSMEIMKSLVIESIENLDVLIDAVADTEMPRPIAAVRALVISTWNETLSASQIAQEVGMSTAHLSRLFNQHMGCSIPAFRNHLRIERAKAELKTTDKSITEIAFGCGFNSLTHFNRVFHSEVGASPSFFRK